MTTQEGITKNMNDKRQKEHDEKRNGGQEETRKTTRYNRQVRPDFELLSPKKNKLMETNGLLKK
jgi:hypothetical protein